MHLELSLDEARFLHAQLDRHMTFVEDELVHTDARALQADLARDLDHLRALQKRLDQLLGETARAA